jgi:hypothetical protein
MIEKISRLAETVSGNVVASRRGFFVRVGKAAAAAVALGGVLLLPKEAEAGTFNSIYVCYYRTSSGVSCGQITHCGGCPLTYKGCTLSAKIATPSRCPRSGDPTWS